MVVEAELKITFTILPCIILFIHDIDLAELS
jgi:hypothetical protein